MSDDLIRRSDVIEITAETGALETQIRVKRLPTIEHRRGEWIINANRRIYKYHCTNCENNSKVDYDFCPWCGADMRGKDDEH